MHLERKTPYCPVVLVTFGTTRWLLSSATSQLYTLYLFTQSDMKTVMLPVTTFAVACGRGLSADRLTMAVFWLWCHLLQCDIANQAGRHWQEDAINRPWRPIPSGRISRRNAQALRWFVSVWCLTLSAYLGASCFFLSIALTVDNVLHNDFGWSDHWLGKNVCNAVAYGIFEWATTSLAGAAGNALDDTAQISVMLSTLVIASTVHMQDFADISGDMASGRCTIPIRFPGRTARTVIGCTVCAWSLALGTVWRLDTVSCALFVAFGGWIAYRIVRFNSESSDADTFVFYNIWLMMVHFLPIASGARGREMWFSRDEHWPLTPT